MKRSILALLAVLAAVAVAQNGEEVRKALEETDRLLRRAEPMVTASGNEEAIALFREAEADQRDAWGLFNQRRFMQAAGRTGRARYKLEQAIRLAEFDPEQVARELRRTQELIDELRPIVMRSGIREAVELGRMAEKEQETARREFEARRFALALRFTSWARQHARKAGELVMRQGGRERLRRELERTSYVLDGARERLGDIGDERVLELFNRADEWQRQAMDAFRAGDGVKALRLTLAARDLLMRGWAMARGEANPELVEQALEETDRLVSEWHDIIRAEGDAEAVRVLETALDHQRRARGHYTEERLKPAMQETTLARRLLDRAIEMVQSEQVLPGPGDNGPDED